MTTLYVVMGSYGEYSDRSEWLVAAYANRELAEKHVLAVTQALLLWFETDEDWRELRVRVNGDGHCASQPLDRARGFAGHDYAQRYWLGEVQLLEEVPE